ncbi:hypothetical protein QBC44DRAFT_251817 [Cladorrhinum sp. PSN332]|nr:hypothetical protein QBC44DRAFT_251817 [Cladorrhinum sp. PSN332]
MATPNHHGNTDKDKSNGEILPPRSSQRIQKPSPAAIPPDVQKAFDSALDDRPYRVWTDPNSGSEITAHGAMLPAGYTQFDNPEFPWICPIRSCRELFAGLFGLGKHFNTSHRASRLNDNTDGTFTELGKYAIATAGDGVSCGGFPKPPIVVSKQPMGRDLPMVEPDLARARVRVLKSNQQRQCLNAQVKKSLPAEPSVDDDISAEKTIPSERSPSIRHSLAALREMAQKPISKPPIQKGLTMANKKRPYNEWTDGNGDLMVFQGVFIPEGYKYDTTVAGRPWICSIRSCRKLFSARYDFSNHFKSSHRGSLLNDNMDGTFTILEQDRSREASSVVSQGLMDTESIADPLIPTYPKANGKTIAWVKAVPQPKAVRKGSPDSSDLSVTNSQLWKDICSSVDQMGVVRPQVQPLLKLSRLRDVDPPKPLARNLTYRQVTALLVQATGKVNSKTCSNCRRGEGLLGDCISVALEIAPQLLEHMNSLTLACANCLYQKQGQSCSVKRFEWITSARRSKNPQREGVAVEDDMDVDKETDQDLAVESLNSRASAGDKSSTAARGTHGHSGQSSSVDTASAAGSWSNRLKRGRNVKPTAAEDNVPEPKRTKRYIEPDEGSVEPEDWEVVNGRVAGASSDNLAASMSVAAQESFNFSPNSAVIDIIIQPGTRHEFRAEATRARCCLVSNGKLKVQVGDEPQFAIGMRGRFRIDPKVPCSVVNRSYENVFLTVISENLRRE